LSTQTIEELQKIIADESRSTEDREAAAKHILVLQGHTEELARQDSKAERRAQFSGEQQRLAEALSRGRQSFNLVERNTDAVVIMDKLASLQIIRLMLDPDGSDGVIYAATNWNSRSNQSLADRMGDHKSQDEANPAYRLRMQSHEDQVTYAKRECATMRTPYVESVPEKKLEDAVRMTSQEFAEFAVSFHRKSLSWQLKGFVYDNLNLPGTAFFPRFIALQKASDEAEETIYKGAYAAHLRATDPQSGEEEAQGFLGMLACMREMERQAEAKSAERMKNRAPVIEAAPEPEEDDATPVPENTVPWYLQPSYLEEERKKEELSRASASYLI
jgi:hypothetical protein